MDTIQYKDRALQTTFQMRDGKQVLELTLEGDECSEELAFVFKVTAPLQLGIGAVLIREMSGVAQSGAS